jgi:hypothetical protein
MKNLLWMVALLAVAVTIPAQAQAQVTIKDIVDNPGKYSDNSVTVEGVVDRHVEDSGNSDTKNYILRGTSGQELRIRTTDAPPSVGSDVEVEGIVSISPFNRKPYVDEKSRSAAGGGTASAQEGGGDDVSEALAPGISFFWIVVIAIAAAFVVFVFGYSIYTSSEQKARVRAEQAKKAQEEKEAAEKQESQSTPGDGLSSTEIGVDGSEGNGAEQRIKSESSSSGGGGGGPATLKFKAPPKTMKFIPGKLVVAAGPDQGKEFRIAGHPTPEGNVVTLGRAEVEGERAFAHIQLGETYRTVSRMQAEIVQQDQDIFLKNKSTTNPTMVNGEQVPPEEMVELEDGDMIRMGEMMLRYERD